MKRIYLYKIVNTLNGKVYIGQTVNTGRRWSDHKWLSKHKQEQYIHRAMNKYGIEKFEYVIIAVCRSSEDANDIEKTLIEQYRSRNQEFGYNIAPGGETPWNKGLSPEQQPMYGKHHSEESRKKISEGNIGKKMSPHTDEWKQKCTEWLTGRPVSEETGEKLSNSNKGLKRSEQTRKRISEYQSGKNLSSAQKMKISLSKRKFNDEQELEIFEASKTFSIKELAKIYSCSRPTIVKAIKKYRK